jgi:hypothetical protein
MGIRPSDCFENDSVQFLAQCLAINLGMLNFVSITHIVLLTKVMDCTFRSSRRSVEYRSTGEHPISPSFSLWWPSEKDTEIGKTGAGTTPGKTDG